MKALVKVGYACNDHCTFCHTLEVRHVDGSAAEVHRKIERAAQLGHDMVVLSGGEPTIRPELFEWAAHAARLGLDFGLVTNGRLLAYPDAVERLLALRLRYVYLSLHGGTPRVHNLMVRADAFSETFAAVGNLAGRGLDFTVNCVVTRHNLDHLDGVVDALAPYPDVVLKLSMVQPKGGGDRHFDALVPRVTDVADRVRRAFARARAARPAARLAHDGIPLCLVPGEEHLYDDLKTHRFATMVEVGEADFAPVDDADKIQPAPCAGCALRGPCPGLYRGYHEAFGDGELRPVTGRPRSNSFHYVLERTSPLADDAPCPLLDGASAPYDRARHLFVRHAGRFARFRTGTRDFADVEIAATKHDTGQLYVDATRKPAVDDFARDLVPLRRSPACAPCPERPRCTGVYHPLLEDVFGRDDARVRELVAALDGDVLDVGCGHAPYAAALAPAAAAGRLRYVGLDPDAAHLAAVAAALPFATLRAGRAESLLDEPPARFDHALVLRSFNHLADPARALAGLVRALRPGGTLLVVDNVVFGLARTPAQAARAEASPARFEHYRNDGAAEAHALAARFPLELVERRDVGPGTSNQWLLRYRLPFSVGG